MNYRPEIDGLRAIAILPVVLFHAGFDGFEGGYVGVDVFFVISGYLITNIIIRDLKSNSFSILKFYERRARRLLPALFTVLATCSVVAMVFLPPVPLKDFGRDLIAVGLFVSNIMLWRTSDYFSRPAEENPLLHMWSLAVEEQFYIIFPFLMLLLWRSGSFRLIVTVLSFLFLASLIISEWGWRNSPIANYFLLPPRAFEILAGTACAILLERYKMRGNNLLSFFGLALIAVAVVFFDRSTPFPSLLTLLPVGGAMLIVVFACPRTLVAAMLSWRPIVLIGLVSYSTYLWHQPLFAFVRMWRVDEPSKVMMLLLSGGAFILGWLTWKFVEVRFRDHQAIYHESALGKSTVVWDRNKVLCSSLFGLISFSALGVVLLVSNGLILLYDADDRYFLSIDPRQQGAYVERSFNEIGLAQFPSNELPNVLVIGDSHAQDFVNVIMENNLGLLANISTFHINPQCGNLYVERDLSGYISSEYRQICSREVGYASPELHARMAEADTIVVVASWREWNTQYIAESFDNISRHTTARLVLVGPKYFGSISIQQILSLSAEERADLRLDVPDTHVLTNNQMRELGFLFIDLHGHLCDDRTNCPIFTDDLRLISYDGGHLTREGARYIGQVLLARSNNFRLIFGLNVMDQSQ